MYLFVCSQGRLRSRTAEILCLLGGAYARSCGTDESADVLVTDSLLRQADRVFCMEMHHRFALTEFSHYQAVPTHVLSIDDKYHRMNSDLAALLVAALQPVCPPAARAVAAGMERYLTLPKPHQLALATTS